MHLKRTKAEKTWPIPRKGSVYLAKPSHAKKHGIALIIMIRDVLEIVKSKKEAKKILNQGKIKINNKAIRDEKYPLLIFDKLEIGGKIYQIIISENKKFEAREVKNLETKTAKIINKKILKSGKIQINLSDGRNITSKEKLKTGDSLVLNLKDNKIEKILQLKEGADIYVTGGKHLGKMGKIEKIDAKNGLAEVKSKDKINIKLDNLMVI